MSHAVPALGGARLKGAWGTLPMALRVSEEIGKGASQCSVTIVQTEVQTRCYGNSDFCCDGVSSGHF